MKVLSHECSDSESVNRLLQFLAKEGEHADKHQNATGLAD